MQLEKYSFGIGDRFAHQGKAQLKAMIQAKQAGIDIAPVWNKSHREHAIIHTKPESVRQEAFNLPQTPVKMPLLLNIIF